ncbi:HicB family regulator domain-containing protein [Rhizobium phage RHph_TM16]|nr:HicB family regulator domain-containing protein [Rhizobium phage RHph_TM16]
MPEPIVLRIAPDLKEKLRLVADKAGVRSLNQYIVTVLELHVGIYRSEQQHAISDLEKRVGRVEELVTLIIEAEGLHHPPGRR